MPTKPGPTSNTTSPKSLDLLKKHEESPLPQIQAMINLD